MERGTKNSWTGGGLLLAFMAVAWLLPQPASAQLGSLVVNITAPSSGQTVGGTITVRASVTVIGLLTVSGVQFKVDGANIGGQDGSAPYAATWNTTGVGNGSHTLTAVARTPLGLSFTSSPVTVIVANGPPPDTTPPNVSMTSPANGATVSGTVAVSANASDNVGVVGVRFRVDGVNLGAEDLSAPYSTSWNTAGVANGTHTLTAVARDAAGNTRTSAAVTVNVANGGGGGARFEEDNPAVVAAPATAWVRRGPEIAAFSGGAAVSSSTAGATVTFTFSGTQVTWIGLRCNICGISTAAIDGGPAARVDTGGTAAPGTPGLASGPVFTASGLAPGAHTLVITVTGTTSTGGSHVIVDAFDVAGGSGGGTTRFEANGSTVSSSPAGAWVQRGPEIAAFSGGTAFSSDVTGATASFTFTGRQVSWIGLRCNACGIATVSIDGGAAGQVNTAGPTTPGTPGLASETVFTASGLAAGSHTLVITVTGNSTSGGANIILDAFDVTP